MVQIRHFQTLRLFSADVARSASYYRQLLGVEPVEELDGFVSFVIAGVCLDISTADEKSPASPGGAVGYWLVDSLQAVIDRAEQLGGRAYRGPLRVEETQRTILQIQDPLGGVVGFEEAF